MSKVRAHRVVWAVKPFAPKWHFLCEYEPILVLNVERHPRHLRCVHIHRRVEMKLWETLLSMALPYTLYIYMEKKKTLFTLSDTGIHYVFTLISSFRHWAIEGVSQGGISLTGNYEKELMWPSLAARKREWEKEKDEKVGRVESWSQGRFKEEAPPKRAGSWGENSDN